MEESLKRYDNDEHAEAIETIAVSTEVPREEVRTIYERVLAELQQKARIKTFLGIFTARRVKELLLRRQGLT